MATLDYTPTIDGAPYDPQPAGGAVTTLDLYDNPARTGVPIESVGPATVLRPGLYQFTIPDTLIGRFWAKITWTKDSTNPPIVDSTERIDLPFDSTLMCSPEDVGSRLNLPLPLTTTQREQIIDAILDAQSDVEGFLNRPLTPSLQTLTGVWPAVAASDLYDYRSWPQTQQYDDKVTILSYTLNADTSYDVSVAVGLDARNTPAIVRYVRAHTVETLRDNPDIQMGKRLPTSISAEGQSVSWQQGRSGLAQTEGKAGAVPNISSLSRYKRLSVYRRDRVPQQPWPYRTGPMDLWP